jgi:RHS repeat-associated protein
MQYTAQVVGIKKSRTLITEVLQRALHVSLIPVLLLALVLSVIPSYANQGVNNRPDPLEKNPPCTNTKNDPKGDECDGCPRPEDGPAEPTHQDNEQDGSQDEDEDCDKEVSPACSDAPIALAHGAVIERVVSLRMPGNGLDWTKYRTYSSDYKAADSVNWPLGHIQGNRWQAGDISDFVGHNTDGTTQTPLNDNKVNLYLYAGSASKRTSIKMVPQPPTGTIKYQTPKDSRTSIWRYDVGGTSPTISATSFNGSSRGSSSGSRGGQGNPPVYAQRNYHDVSDTNVNKRGVIKQASNRQGTRTISYDFSTTLITSGRITQATTSQNTPVEYYYIASGETNEGKLEGVDVKNDSDEVIMRTRYLYMEDGNNDYDSTLGSEGDLIQVTVLRRASGDNQALGNDPDAALADSYFSIKEVTQYRYHADSKLKMVLEPGDVEKILSDANGLVGPIAILGEADDDSGTGTKDIQDYASRSFTYYASAFNTSANQITDWSNQENLGTKYGGTNLADETGMVKTESIRSGCPGCGGSSGGGITRTYYYMDLNGGLDSTASATQARRIVIEDTQDADGNAVYRKVMSFNGQGYKLREALIENPLAETQIKAWCTSWIRGTTGYELNRIKEKRLPSAHTVVDSASEMPLFLNPTASNYDDATLNNSTGRIYVYDYDYDHYEDANGYYYVYKGVKNGDDFNDDGVDNDTYWYVYRKYGKFDGTNNDQTPRYRLVEKYKVLSNPTTKPVPATISNDDKVRYTYTFHDSNELQLKTKTIIYEKVPVSENGSGVAIQRVEYYDTYGKPRWIKNGDGYVHYYAYHPDTGRLAYRVIDVDTSSLPTAITSGDPTDSNSDGIAYSAWSVGAGLTRTSGLPTALGIVSQWGYDDQGRKVKKIGGGGKTDYFVYESDRNLVFPAWDTTNNQSILPIRARVTNSYGKSVESYTVKPDRVALDGSLPKGLSSGTSRDHYIAWSTNTYNDENLLESTRVYHDIPAASSTPVVSANFYETFYKYDALGRRTHIINNVSGASPATGGVEQVTKRVYDVRDRATEIHKGVSIAGHPMNSGYAADPTLVKVSQLLYDETAPGSGTPGIGDGYVTTTRSYYDGANYTSASTHRDFRGRTRGIEPDVAPYTVVDVDNRGRAIAGARFSSAPTWSSVLTTSNFASNTSTNRLSFVTASYDNMGRLYQAALYEVNSSGTKDDAVVTKRYRNGRSQTIGIASGGSGATEVAYDGAGHMYQSRIVTDLEFTSGVFSYSDPTPVPGINVNTSDETLKMTGGGDKVVELSHRTFDNGGNVTRSITLRANHNDSDGLEIGGATDDYTQTAAYAWYDDAGRLTDTAYYGTNDGAWALGDLAKRGAIAPLSTDPELVVRRSYADNRLESIEDPKGIDSTRMFDDLGRVVQLVEADGVSGLERRTLAEYNGLSKLAILRADVDIDDTFANGVWTDSSPGDDQVTTYTYEDPRFASLVTKVQYPDSSGDPDVIEMAYHDDGTLSTHTDQRGREITMEYGAGRRPLKQRVTTPGTDVDTSIQSIVRDYDDHGRLNSVASYSQSNPTIGTDTPLNEVVLEYTDYGALKKDRQDHDSGVDETGGMDTLEVLFAYDETSDASDVFTKRLRRNKMTYPNGREVHFLYDGGSSGKSDELSRISAIANASTRGTDDANVIVGYEYAGLGAVVRKDYPEPDIRLDYWGDTNGTYDGFDRFGRTAEQRWERYDGSGASDGDIFFIKHGYDKATNRLYADRQVDAYKSRSQFYAYDQLHRLTDFQSGETDYGTSTPAVPEDIQDYWELSGQGFELDALGNQTAIDTPESTDYFKTTADDANQIDTRAIKGNRAPNYLGDIFSTNSASDWDKPTGATETITVTTNSPGYLSFTGTMRADSISDNTEQRDNNGTPENDPRAIALLGESIGPFSGLLRIYIPTGGQAGWVFGYKNPNDYWTYVLDEGANRAYIYHVLNGNKNTHVAEKEVNFSAGWMFLEAVFRRGTEDWMDYNFSSGFPSGRVGVYADSTGVQFDYIRIYDDATNAMVAGRWIGDALATIDSAEGNMNLYANRGNTENAMLLDGVHVDRFDAAFTVKQQNNNAYSTCGVKFIFNATDQDDYDFVQIYHSTAALAPKGYEVIDGSYGSLVTPDSGASTMPTFDSSNRQTKMYVRVIYDGTSLRVFAAYDGAALDSAVSAGTYVYKSTSFDMAGGMVGFASYAGMPRVDDLTLKADRNENGSVDANETEYVDDFDYLDASGYATDELKYDPAGNLEYDGRHKFTYDAWNRLVKVEHAYRDDTAGSIGYSTGSTIATMQYDGLGRRIVKDITNSAEMDETYHYYYAGYSIIQTNNEDEDGQMLKQYVWGTQYIDELIQVGYNQDPQNADSHHQYYTSMENECEYYFYPMQDANFNIMGIVNQAGRLVERYEYTPYGQRTVYSHGVVAGDVDGDGFVGVADLNAVNTHGVATGPDPADLDGDGYIGTGDLNIVLGNWNAGHADTNDKAITYPTLASARVTQHGTERAGPALCEVGHQGLFHDEEFGAKGGLVYNRNRILNSRIKRFMQKDPMGYFDGMSLYQYVYSNPLYYADPAGLSSLAHPANAALAAQCMAEIGGTTTGSLAAQAGAAATVATGAAIGSALAGEANAIRPDMPPIQPGRGRPNPTQYRPRPLEPYVDKGKPPLQPKPLPDFRKPNPYDPTPDPSNSGRDLLAAIMAALASQIDSCSEWPDLSDPPNACPSRPEIGPADPCPTGRPGNIVEDENGNAKGYYDSDGNYQSWW